MIGWRLCIEPFVASSRMILLTMITSSLQASISLLEWNVAHYIPILTSR